MSAVVVHYRGRAPLRRCLDALLAGRRVTEVLVVDNEGVGPAIRREHSDPRVRVIQMARNAGYGRAANAGDREGFPVCWGHAKRALRAGLPSAPRERRD